MQALTYDDIQLVPSFSNIKSRQSIKLHTLLSRRYGILTPLVASPMDTVCEEEMAFKMFLLGGVGCIHRFMSAEEQAAQVKSLSHRIYGDGFGGPYEEWGIMLDDWHSEISLVPVMAAIGVGDESKERARLLVEAGANVLLIDVAHGDHQNVIDMLKWCKENLKDKVDIIAGNIATAEAAERLQEAGADGLRVGIGGGSLCGIRSSGDIAKALAVGANNVMLGSLLAGTDEAPGKIIEKGGSLYKRYRGSASLETKTAHGQEQRNVEGESTTIPFKGGVKFVIGGLIDGVKSALSYAGADSLDKYAPTYVEVTNSGAREAKPHLIS